MSNASVAQPKPTEATLRVINFKFPLQPHPKYYITQYEELAFHSLLRWKMIFQLILDTAIIHFLFKLVGECTFQLRSERIKTENPFSGWKGNRLPRAPMSSNHTWWSLSKHCFRPVVQASSKAFGIYRCGVHYLNYFSAIFACAPQMAQTGVRCLIATQPSVQYHRPGGHNKTPHQLARIAFGRPQADSSNPSSPMPNDEASHGSQRDVLLNERVSMRTQYRPKNASDVCKHQALCGQVRLRVFFHFAILSHFGVNIQG